MSTLAVSPTTPTTAAAKAIKRSENDIITGLQNTVSASRLSLFLQCRLKFYFRYVLEIPKAKTPSLHVGSAVHTVLKAWNKARWIQKPITLKEAHDVFSTAWEEQAKENPVSWDDGEEDAEKLTAWRLCDTCLREAHLPATLKPDAVEVSVEANLASHGLPRLVGVLDLVQQRQIIDYKTASSTPQADKVAHTTEVQTSSYAILYRHNTGQREHGIQLHHLVKLKNPKIIITPLPPMSEQQQTRLFHLMEAYVNGLDRRDFVPAPGDAVPLLRILPRMQPLEVATKQNPTTSTPAGVSLASTGLLHFKPSTERKSHLMKLNLKHLARAMLCGLVIFITSCSQAHAGWFGWGDDERARQQREEEQRRRLAETEQQLTAHRKSVELWELATGTAAAGALFLLVIGTALGTRTRHAARAQS